MNWTRTLDILPKWICTHSLDTYRSVCSLSELLCVHFSEFFFRTHSTTAKSSGFRFQNPLPWIVSRSPLSGLFCLFHFLLALFRGSWQRCKRNWRNSRASLINANFSGFLRRFLAQKSFFSFVFFFSFTTSRMVFEWPRGTRLCLCRAFLRPARRAIEDLRRGPSEILSLFVWCYIIVQIRFLSRRGRPACSIADDEHKHTGNGGKESASERGELSYWTRTKKKKHIVRETSIVIVMMIGFFLLRSRLFFGSFYTRNEALYNNTAPSNLMKNEAEEEFVLLRNIHSERAIQRGKKAGSQPAWAIGALTLVCVASFYFASEFCCWFFVYTFFPVLFLFCIIAFHLHSHSSVNCEARKPQ